MDKPTSPNPDIGAKDHDLTEAVLRAARAHPHGWLYKVDGEFDADQRVSPEFVVGAWEVDGQGNPVGDFIANPGYVRPAGH